MYVPAGRAGIGYWRLSGPLKISPLKTCWPVLSVIATLWLTPGSLLVNLRMNGWPAGALRVAWSKLMLWAVSSTVVSAAPALADGAGGGVAAAVAIWPVSQVWKSAGLRALT